MGQSGQQVGVLALADHAPVVQHQYQVGAHDGGGALGDDEHRGPVVQGQYGPAQPGVRGHVQGRGAVVQDQDLRPARQRPGDGQPLPLAAGQVAAVLLDLRVQAALGRQHVRSLGGLGGGQQLGVGGVGPAPAQVVPYGALEQRGLLHHHADPAAQRRLGPVLHIHAVDQHLALGGLVEAGNQPRHGALARAGAADDAHGLARPGGEIHVLERRTARAGVGQRYVPELHRRGGGVRRFAMEPGSGMEGSSASASAMRFQLAQALLMVMVSEANLISSTSIWLM